MNDRDVVLKARIQRFIQQLTRLIVSAAIVITLAVLGLWDWAQLWIGLCILGEVSTVGTYVKTMVEERDLERRRS